MDAKEISLFIETWTRSGGAERANYQLFLSQLAALIGAPQVEPTVPSEAANNYVFEKTVWFKHVDGTETNGFIDLYKRGCFVCEAKQSVKEGKRATDRAQIALFGEEDAGHQRSGTARVGTAGWDLAMERARRQAENYAKALPKEHGWPPFLVIVDVGHCFELFADFSGQGKNYAQFPDRRSFRIMLADLENEDVRTRLNLVWTDPHALDPAKRSAEVTRDIAERLAIVAKELEKTNPPQTVALFLMRCLFTMFAEDVELLPKDSFLDMLKRFRGRAGNLHNALADLWQKMNAGGFSAGLEERVRHFNGGLFANATALPITEEMLGHIIVAADRKWGEVEPAIFGTLLERALSPSERSQLGAHYTPRAYVERLVVPTIMEPLQDDWAAARVEAQQLLESAQRKREEAEQIRLEKDIATNRERGDRMRRLQDEARADVRAARRSVALFLERLCSMRVLDPACGTGNFLYVSMELMKRLEGEVREYLRMLGGQDELQLGAGEADGRVVTNTIDPHNFLGIELNPRAKEIAELVLWLGFLKWQLRTNGPNSIADPVLRDFKTIEWRDALLAWERQELLCDESGTPISRWDGKTMKRHPITGEEVPDETARIEQYKYINPRIAAWPEAEFIIGNPPFVAGQDLREELGDGYAEALWSSRAKRKHIPQAADIVMYWWDRAAEQLTTRGSGLRRFGFVTTNSITQTFNRRIIQHYLDAERPLSVVFGVPNHPWVKGNDRAAVRIAMTVAEAGQHPGVLKDVESETELDTDAPRIAFSTKRGRINADITTGVDVSSAAALQSNSSIAHDGVKLHGKGFAISFNEARSFGLESIEGASNVIRPYRNGRDVAQTSRDKYVLDFFGMSEPEVRERFPAAHAHIMERVFPERAQNRRAQYRDRWWIFGEPREKLRAALTGLSRQIVTVDTARHRVFQFADVKTVFDDKIVCIALDDAAALAVLSSRHHVSWATRAGGWLGVGNDPVYVKTRCFDTFALPELSVQSRERLAALGEELDAFRKARQREHSGLTITAIYNVLEKERNDEELSDEDRLVHERALVSTLKRIHDQIDEAVAAAYGWPSTLDEEQVLERLAALNRERVEEEKRNVVRWLRPDFQRPAGATATPVADEQTELEVEETSQKPVFPDAVGERARAVRNILVTMGKPATPREVWQSFHNGGSYSKSVRELLETMAALGQAVERDGKYFAA